jgi:hypothetical protein
MNLKITKYCSIKNNRISVNSDDVFCPENNGNFNEFIKSAYKSLEIAYPKFYKMDGLCKLAFITSEFLLKDSGFSGKYEGKDIGVVIENFSSTLTTDIDHQKTIDDRSSYFPSPSIFVYTLPNIMIGEICIKNNIFGENALLISEKFDIQQLVGYVNGLFVNEKVKSCIAGLVEYNGIDNESLLFLVEKDDMSGKIFNFETINNLYQGE